MIGRHRSTNGPQHEITGEQEKKVTESQQETLPLALTNIDQIQKDSILQDGDRLTRS